MTEELALTHGKGDFVRSLTDAEATESRELAVRLMAEYALRGREEIDNVNLTVKSIDNEVWVITERIKPFRAAINRLKEIRALIREGMIAAADRQQGGTFKGFNTDGISAYIQSEHVMIEDEDAVPDRFMRETVVRAPDKVAILKHWKETGLLPAGVAIEPTLAVRFKNRK